MSSNIPPQLNDDERNAQSKQNTHELLQDYKKALFNVLSHKLSIWSFGLCILAIKIMFCLCVVILLLSYLCPHILPNKVELQDFLLKILAGGFLNQIIFHTFGYKK